MEEPLQEYESQVRQAFNRISRQSLSDRAWEQAKQPIRTIGLGLQSLAYHGCAKGVGRAWTLLGATGWTADT